MGEVLKVEKLLLGALSELDGLLGSVTDWGCCQTPDNII